MSVDNYKRKVLFVDDEQAVRKTAEMMLKHLGYDPICCGTSKDAIELCKLAYDSGNCFEIAILDHNLKGDITGIELYSKLEKINPIQAVLCTGSIEDSNVIQEGFKALLYKPFSLRKLEKTLQSLE